MTFDELARKLESSASRTFGHGVSEDDIRAASARLGVSLTGGYLRFLRRFGWGGVGSFELFGLGADVPPYLHLVTVTESERTEVRPRLPSHLIPLMNDGGGNLYCLDVRSAGEPAVVFWDHEASEEQSPEPVASDFISWLANRLEQPD
ncbi:SMI1/KNR4 family protein [Hyalangium gracile]|uniref:SMI1/KNR4 family protein n=1 Tax=Hyalangium gracile TaxID=394092 RepID=UPI001CCA21FB|nr:SMI1/KNR4 family protein [Hyalangium gracile]